MKERIVITGMGTVNPLGLSVSETWNNIINGVSGIGPIYCFDSTSLRVKIACEIKGINPELYMSAKEVRRRDRVEQLAAAGAKQAIQQSGILETEIDPSRISVIISSAVGGINTLQDTFRIIEEQGANRVRAFAIPMLMTNGLTGIVAIGYGFQGPCFSIGSACASGIDAICLAWILLKNKIIDVAVTGATESTVLEVAVAIFDKVGALSRRNEDYSCTPQPYDLNRDGLVIGEGSGVIVMESENHAKKRGAQILAEIAGYAASSDTSHITAPRDDGGGGIMAIKNAIKAASIGTNQIDYIDAHGTGIVLNDVFETKAIKTAIGEIAYNIPVSSTKSMTGYLMGATGALETILCVKSIQDCIIPPTTNYQTADPECDLDYVPNIAREKLVNVVLNNAFGFGGHNAVLVICRY